MGPAGTCGGGASPEPTTPSHQERRGRAPSLTASCDAAGSLPAGGSSSRRLPLLTTLLIPTPSHGFPQLNQLTQLN